MLFRSASLHRFVHRFSGNNARGLQLNSLTLIRLNWTVTVDGFTEWVENATEQTITNWNVDDRASTLDNISFLNFSADSKLVLNVSVVLTCRYPK